jgi:NAD(P)-dependent dehydrogenase (short-subunit alcohol dehydrogenase family)
MKFMEIICVGWVKNNSSLKGKLFIITGANSGLGFQTAKALAKRGAKIVLACRDLLKANEAVRLIKLEAPNANLITLPLDLESFDSVKTFCTDIRREFPDFDCIINNAGLSIKEPFLSEGDIEVHTSANHLGHFLMTYLLLDLIKKNNARVVIVSSKLHEKGVINFEKFGKLVESDKTKQLYANSKLMNFYFAKELYKKGIDVHVCCPGLCYTDLFRDYTIRFYHWIVFAPIALFFLRSAEQGAQNIIHCATDNENDAEKNPSNSYIVINLRQTKSKINLADDISEKLWTESMKLCKID